jgi:murein DD-endopeptidase MepM/ murein hydrolase activator NlpD
MRHWQRILAPAMVLAVANCASLSDNKVYQETRDISVKTAKQVGEATSKTVDRMKHYMAEKDVLMTFHDAGEHSETAVLAVLHKAGVGRGGGSAAPSGKSASPGAPKAKSAPSPASPALPVPDQYAGTLRWPLDAYIVSSEYGERWGKMHKGLDLAADSGEPVYAIATGDVIYAGDGLHGYGNVVILRHDRQLTSLYAHNRELKVHQGDHVSQGTLIALLGNTGHSTGPHVHFEIREGDTPVNPRTVLPKSNVADAAQKGTHVRVAEQATQ